MRKKVALLGLVLAIALVVSAALIFAPAAKTTPNLDDAGATPESAASVVAANNRFASELYSRYKSQPGNVFFSPFSISSALAMTYEGAAGKTAEEMQNVFHFPTDAAVRRPAFARIYNDLNKGSGDYQLSVANALWAEKTYGFLDGYLQTVKDYYGGGVTNMDFVGDAEGSRQTINGWVEDRTNDKIKDLIPPEAIDSLTRLVLTNAIYFKGTWVIQFDKAKTKEEDFRVKPGQTVKAPMMRLTGEKAEFGYAETEELQALEMPYKGDGLSMLVLLPKGDGIGPAEELISGGGLTGLRNNLSDEQVDVYMPKFKFETKYFMANDLAEMGMPGAFVYGTADFSGMDGSRNLYISAVIHQAFVDVNEEGTEAAAATAVVMSFGSAMPSQQKVFRADHPFVFIIQEKATGNILFLGRVSDPTKG